ncbi:MAG TPA: cyclic nucleotide-binding domain-containing protein, partial [Solirubrobacteraceae bacterium]|nr:cyclic nucleotide-binding domain-containing protein [Solirubrobacteraceae bacterium]
MRKSVAVLGRVLRNPRLRRVELAFAGFAMAEYGVWTAILVYAYTRGGTTTAGLIAVLQLVPAAVVAPLAAAVTDRRGGAFALALGYALQAMAMGATGALMLAGAPPAGVYAAAVVAASAVTLSRPAQASLLASLVEHPDELTAATAASGWMESASALAGPALAGLLIALDGPGLVFAAFAIAVGGSLLLVSRLKPTEPPAADDADADADASQDDGVLAGLRILRRESATRALVLVIAAEHLAIGALDVLVVVLAISALGLGSPAAGYLNAAFGLGATLGALAAVGLIGARSIARPLIGAAIAWGVAFVVLGVVRTVPVAFVLLPVAGLCQAVVDTAGRSLLVRVTPHAVLGRVFGVLEGLAMAALAAGSLLVPILVALGGVRLALLGVAAVLVAAATLPLASLCAVDRAVPRPDAMRLLRGHPLFSSLPAPVLEGLARDLQADPVRAGRVVITEGDIGDRFYLVADGSFEVTIAGSHLGTLGAGDG